MRFLFIAGLSTEEILMAPIILIRRTGLGSENPKRQVFFLFFVHNKDIAMQIDSSLVFYQVTTSITFKRPVES